MPYTPEELQNLQWYQDLIDQDEQQYLNRKRWLTDNAAPSGSAYDGNLLVRNQNGTVLLFENPYQNKLPEDETTMVVHNIVVKSLKKDESINEFIDRQFEEL